MRPRGRDASNAVRVTWADLIYGNKSQPDILPRASSSSLLSQPTHCHTPRLSDPDMDADSITITVFVKLPVSSGSSSWTWFSWLIFPVNVLRQPNFSRFLLKPFKWVRFFTGITLGSRGCLYDRATSPEAVEVDYDGPLPTTSLRIYYHADNEDSHYILPTDLDVLDERTTTTYRAYRDSHFLTKITDRDGTCVLTGTIVDGCHAAHLVPVRKGDSVCIRIDVLYRLHVDHFEQYIRSIIERPFTGTVVGTNPVIIDDIDDTCNGILLAATLNQFLGKTLSFLVVRLGLCT
jgi:hypothetical protein